MRALGVEVLSRFLLHMSSLEERRLTSTEEDIPSSKRKGKIEVEIPELRFPFFTKELLATFAFKSEAYRSMDLTVTLHHPPRFERGGKCRHVKSVKGKVKGKISGK